MRISHGRAAEILGIGKLDLIALYNEMGLPYLDMDISEVEEDVNTYRNSAPKAFSGGFDSQSGI